MAADIARSAVATTLLVFAWAGITRAAPPQPDRDIQALIGALADSPCRFQRNGNWYDGPRAAAHLQRKYDYLRERDPATTPEQFIQRAASRSSVSGRTYRVACPGQPEREAGPWFDERLRALRTGRAWP